jgi:hypothetical protein
MAVTSDTRVPQVSNPLLREYLDQLDALRLDARELCAGMTAQQMNWRPDERRWSVGQCLDHLTRSLQLYLQSVERMLEESRTRKQRGERGYRDGLVAGWLIRSMEPPPSLRVRAPGVVRPAERLDPAAVLSAFDAAHARFGELMTAADGVSLLHGRMSSPMLRLMRMTLRQAMAMNLAHGRRHLWQARQVQKERGFPAS